MPNHKRLQMEKSFRLMFNDYNVGQKLEKRETCLGYDIVYSQWKH